MNGNSFGDKLKITCFGESHGKAMGCIIEGCPAGITVTQEMIQSAVNKRKPVDTSVSTSRKEPDRVEILSGIFNDKTEGTPIALLIRNSDQHSFDYDKLKNIFRPGHADFTYDEKYKGFEDYRGGGRSSGRETVTRVAAGEVARQLLSKNNINVKAYTLEAAGIRCKKIALDEIEQNVLKAPDNDAAKAMLEKIQSLKEQKDSAGGIIECIITGIPCGIGEPVFEKLDAQLAKAMLSIGAVKGIEFGEGFNASKLTGSQNNDWMFIKDSKPAFESNHSGGILGGLSTGQDIIFRIAVKPVASIGKKQKTVMKTEDGFTETELELTGRHDVCLCPRIVPVIEAMACLTIADALLQSQEQ